MTIRKGRKSEPEIQSLVAEIDKTYEAFERVDLQARASKSAVLSRIDELDNLREKTKGASSKITGVGNSLHETGGKSEAEKQLLTRRPFNKQRHRKKG